MTDYEYTYRSSQSALMISEWTFKSYEACSTDVLPDGCRDIIVEECAGQAPILFLSELSQSTYTVPTSGGARIRGMRLRPGIQVRQAELRSWLEGRNPAENFSADQLSEFCFEQVGLSNALECLASEKGTVLGAAKEQGVSVRTLERLVKTGTGRSPYFWFSLARIRKTARSLYETESFGVAALEAGFADQSHMNREMKRWFRKTPVQIINDDYIRNALLEPGCG